MVDVARPSSEDQHGAEHQTGGADAEGDRREIAELLGGVESALLVCSADLVRAVTVDVFVALQRHDAEHRSGCDGGSAEAERDVGCGTIGFRLRCSAGVGGRHRGRVTSAGRGRGRAAARRGSFGRGRRHYRVGIA